MRTLVLAVCALTVGACRDARSTRVTIGAEQSLAQIATSLRIDVLDPSGERKVREPTEPPGQLPLPLDVLLTSGSRDPAHQGNLHLTLLFEGGAIGDLDVRFIAPIDVESYLGLCFQESCIGCPPGTWCDAGECSSEVLFASDVPVGDPCTYTGGFDGGIPSPDVGSFYDDAGSSSCCADCSCWMCPGFDPCDIEDARCALACTDALCVEDCGLAGCTPFDACG